MINRTRLVVLVAPFVIAAVGWAISALTSKNADEDSVLAGPSIIRVVPDSAPRRRDRTSVSVVVDQLADSSDPQSYPILGLQGWSLVLRYDPAFLQLVDAPASTASPLRSEGRTWTRLPLVTDAGRGTVRIMVTSEPRDGNLPLAGGLQAGNGHPLTLAIPLFRRTAAGATRLWLEDVALVPVGTVAAPLPPPDVVDATIGLPGPPSDTPNGVVSRASASPIVARRPSGLTRSSPRRDLRSAATRSAKANEPACIVGVLVPALRRQRFVKRQVIVE